MNENHCPVCCSEKTRIRPPYYLYLERQYDLNECRNCGVYYVWPQPDAETLHRMYGKEYFESDFHCGHSEQTAYVRQEVPLPDWVSATGIRPPADVLEIGCATGHQLKAFRDAGYRCAGVEISTDAAAFAREEYGLGVAVGTVETTAFDEQRFDVTYLHDVFEHLTNPADTLKKIRSWMKPGGIIVIVIPTQTNTVFSRIGMAAYSLLGKRTRVMLPPYHLFEYRPESIRRLLIQAGFQDIRIFPSIMKPSEIALRGSRVQRVMKKFLHYPNYFLTRLTGRYGDRLTVLAKKKKE